MPQTTITFDTLAYARLLKDAGIEGKKAEALAKAQKQALEEAFGSQDLATRADLKIGLAELQNSLIKWMLGLIIGLGAFLSALILGVSGKFSV